MSADSSEIKKRLQGQNALDVEFSAELSGSLINGPAVDNNSQAWHPLKVLDTIEIF